MALSGLVPGRFWASPVHTTVLLVDNAIESGFQDWVVFHRGAVSKARNEGSSVGGRNKSGKKKEGYRWVNGN